MTLLLLAIGLFSKASAYVVSFTNAPETNSTAVPIIDNAWQPIAVGAGYAAVGTFEVVPTSVEEIRSSFGIFGDGPTSFENELFNVNKAFFELSRSAPIPQGTVGGPVGQNIYVVVGGLERGFARYIIRNPFSTEKMEFKPPNAANKDGASFSYGHDFGPQNSDPTAIRSTGTHP